MKSGKIIEDIKHDVKIELTDTRVEFDIKSATV